MQYLYENLGENGFQELCQAILIREFPNVQCFPIRQPDGGRDAIAYHETSAGNRPFTVFQVKFAQKPLSEKDAHKWLLDVLEPELRKIERLIPKGAKSYYLLTNVPGTAHLDSGSIDQLNQLLAKYIPIPFCCWWRSDLDRRLDTAFDLKWLYPQLMTGTDMLRVILEQNLSAEPSRRTSAVRAFIRAQYERDKEVRFKQVELQNDLLALFVDVPIDLKERGDDKLRFLLYHHSDFRPRGEEEHHIGHAASLLLNSNLREVLKQVVLEGAPGQGKSTIAQFICQVHRLLIFGDQPDLMRLSPHFTPSSRSIPIKVDLRDLAAWLNKRDPFSPDETNAVHPDWQKSLESFLAALIRHDSGGAVFSVSDLHAIAEISSILLVLDGLDEVADPNSRKDVISEVTVGVARLRAIAASLQVVVTSRPTAFGPALGFNERNFVHLELASLSQSLISAYAEKWLTARRLKSSEAAAVRRILKQKIEQRHLRDLTRNPMQLTILLSLIHTRGSSLPEKRTALYDGYVELFFNRESEKSEIVREQRELLIDVHRYLAWILHSEAETDQRRGSISSERLQNLLKAYLLREQRDESSVTDLFKGLVERIVFLVARVEGTFEFEVQPLREYFAAKHLYETAPHSPPGRERRGTKPDRFDAVARNPFWLNVTRFFAGCFSKGELPCLVDRLENLAEQERPNFSNRQRRLAAFLLRDWVFSQDQRSLRRAISLVLDGASFQHPLKRQRRTSSLIEEELVLPEGCGRNELLEKCFTILRGKPPSDVVQETIQILVANAGPETIDAFWRPEFTNASGSEIGKWLMYGLPLGSLSRIKSSALVEKLSQYSPTVNELNLVLSAGHSQLVETSETFTKELLEKVLSGIIRLRVGMNVLSRLSEAVQTAAYARALNFGGLQPLKDVFRDRLDTKTSATAGPPGHENSVISQCLSFLKVVDDEIKKPALEWKTELEPWRNVTEKGRQLWGDRPVFYQMANMSATIVSSAQLKLEASDLVDRKTPICDRLRFARTRAGAPSWWKKQFGAASKDGGTLLVLLAFSTLAGPKTLQKLLKRFETELAKLGSQEWSFLARSVREAMSIAPPRRHEKLDVDSMPGEMNERLVVLLGSRSSLEFQQKLYRKFLGKYGGTDSAVASFCLECVLPMVEHESNLWDHVLTLIKGDKLSGPARDPYLFFRASRRISEIMPVYVARKIAADPGLYPRGWVYAARERCEYDVVLGVGAVGTIAEKEGWFEH
jgi:NACHT domain